MPKKYSAAQMKKEQDEIDAYAKQQDEKNKVDRKKQALIKQGKQQDKKEKELSSYARLLKGLK